MPQIGAQSHLPQAVDGMRAPLTLRAGERNAGCLARCMPGVKRNRAARNGVSAAAEAHISDFGVMRRHVIERRKDAGERAGEAGDVVGHDREPG